MWGLDDVWVVFGIVVFYGVCFWVMVVVLGWVFCMWLEYIMFMVSGCLLLGLFLVMGLYDISCWCEVGFKL